MALSKPIITTNQGQSYATNQAYVYLEGQCDPASTGVDVNGSPATYTPGERTWTAGPFQLVNGANSYVVFSTDGVINSPTTSIVVQQITNSQTVLVLSAPTAILAERGRDSIKISWSDLVSQDVRGYQVYYAREAGGGLTGFIPAHNNLISDPDETVEEDTLVSEDITFNPNDDTERTTTTVETVGERATYSLTFSQLPDGTPLDDQDYYFVVSAVAYNSVNRQFVESAYSAEVSGKVISLDPVISRFNARDFAQISQDMATKINLRQPDVDVKPLSFARDVIIDPASDEFNRLWAILTFINASQSLLTLMAFDDPNNDGVSDAFEEGTAKTAFRDALLLDDVSTQAIIDLAFSVKAVDYTSEGRALATQATGKVTFYYEGSNPGAFTIPRGTVVSTSENEELNVDAVEFETTEAISITTTQLSAYYNSVLRRYEFPATIKCRTRGSVGNVPPNSVINVSGAPLGFRVTNEEATDFGEDRESNHDLAVRALVGVAGVDTGTVFGYYRTAISTPGVLKTKVVDAGHPLMYRDWDEVRSKHVGGAVDVYVLGSYFTAVEFEFAFEYPTLTDSSMSVYSLSALQFTADDPDVSVNQPAFELISFRNVTKNLVFDVTNVTITNGRLFELDPTQGTNAANRDASDITDIFVGTFRYRKSNTATFDQQPALSIISITGSISGDLSDNYNLYRDGDPLLYGMSTKANDRIEVFPAGGKPSSNFESIEDTIVLYGLNEVSLSKKGVVEGTIVVTSTDGSTTYVDNIDYEIISGGQFTTPKIKRLSSVSLIPDGGTVKVAYDVGDNITILYLTDSLIQSVDDRINGSDTIQPTRHAAADVLIKSIQQTSVDVHVRIEKSAGISDSEVRNNITSKLTNLFNGLDLGESLDQDDVVAAVKTAPGVDKLNLPIQSLGRADGSLIVREDLSAFTWSQLGVAWVSDQTLTHPTQDGGGFEVGISLTGGKLYGPISGIEDNYAVLTPVELEALVSTPGTIFFRSDGKVILLPITSGDNPNDHTYEVTYRVYSETGPDDIPADDLEVLVPGEFTIDITN